MVKHYSLDESTADAVLGLLENAEFKSHLVSASAVLIQVYCASHDIKEVLSTSRLLQKYIPQAIIAGATTVGEIVSGCSTTGKSIIGVTLFQSAKLSVVHQSIEQDCERLAGQLIGSKIRSAFLDIKGVLLLSTPISINAAELLAGIELTEPDYQVFGGGAGGYKSMEHSFVFCGDHIYEQGAVAVIMSGHELHIESQTYLGWRSLSKPMTVTSVNGLTVETIDDKSAFDIYSKYLSIDKDDKFFLNALEFPFLLQRDGHQLARVPVGVSDNNGLIFVADIKQGETIKLGYGVPELIIDGAKQTLENIHQFNPEAIFLYSCGCRRFLMQEDIDLETQPLEYIAPTFGFYTYGEFFADNTGRLPLLNSTLVAVGISEGTRTNQSIPSAKILELEESQDPYANKHSRIVSRLVQFISATTNELEQASLAKNQFLANTSHELRTPLTSISGYAEAILNGDIARSGVEKAVAIILQQSNHLRSLIEDILDISKMEAHKLKIVASDFDLEKLIYSIEESFSQQSFQAGLNFLVTINDNVPAWVNTDQERLYQILTNLVGNAIKFTPSGSIEVMVNFDEPTQALSFQVIDTGIGLTPEQMELVFQPFQQFSPQHVSARGTGLGLTISQRLASLLGGKITVMSTINSGSCFTLTIPVAAVTASSVNSVKVSGTTTLCNNYGEILLAEDSPENGQLFSLLLQSAGYKVTLVENGQQAVEKALSEQFDLILLDIQMPIMDGLEAIEMILHSTSDCPIVALTANAMPEDVENYIKHGFASCLAKPVSKEQLIECVNNYVQTSDKECCSEVSSAIYDKLHQVAITNMKKDAALLTDIYRQDDEEQVSKLVHKLKGVSGQFEFNEIRQVCLDIEAESDVDSKQALIQRLIFLIEAN